MRDMNVDGTIAIATKTTGAIQATPASGSSQNATTGRIQPAPALDATGSSTCYAEHPELEDGRRKSMSAREFDLAVHPKSGVAEEV